IQGVRLAVFTITDPPNRLRQNPLKIRFQTRPLVYNEALRQLCRSAFFLRTVSQTGLAMRFFVGTSGFSYKEWKGSFYPVTFNNKHMPNYYAQRFATVEMNGTFRRFPTTNAVRGWSEQVPTSFRFVLKAHQSITHRKRLNNVERETDDFLRV